jgi:predicted NUDIX family NTP pyrophosphohydrolase
LLPVNRFRGSAAKLSKSAILGVMKQSAGILVYRCEGDGTSVLLVHPAGPIWAHQGVWSIPKGGLENEEDHLMAAKREFLEEVGHPVPRGPLIDLGSSLVGSPVNFIWAVEGQVDVSKFACNTFTMEWPPKSGIIQEFLENDRAEWFPLAIAAEKIFQSQRIFLERLADWIATQPPRPSK